MVFVVCASAQYLGYGRILAAGLRSGDLEIRRRAMKRWVLFAVCWQLMVLAAVVGYAAVMSRQHPGGLSWIAPVAAALVGTAVPLQLAALRLARAANA